MLSPRRWSALVLVLVTGLVAACGKSTPSTTSSASATPSSAVSITPSPSAGASSTAPKITPSTNLDALKVTGAYGKKPTVTFKAPWAIDKTQTKVLQASNGPVARAGTSVQVNYYGVDGRTGKTFDESFTKGAPVSFPLNQVIAGFKKGLLGQHQGSRVLIAMTGPDGYDASGGQPSGGINVGDTLIFVVDLVQVTLAGPTGSAVPPKAGLPTVSEAKGTPTVSVPKSAPPKTLEVQPLVKGTGPKVTAADTIVSHYVAVAWSTGKVVSSDYGAAPSSGALSATLPGLQKGLVGQTVGSRVLLVVPQAYPSGNATPSVAPTETLVFVVDLLYAAPGQ